MSDIIKQAVESILADTDMKQAILDYFASITVKPKEEWHKIYQRESEPITRYAANSEPKEICLYMRVFYNESGGVGRIHFFEFRPGLFNSFYPPDDYYLSPSQTPETILLDAPTAFKAIDLAFELWTDRFVAFKASAEVADELP